MPEGRPAGMRDKPPAKARVDVPRQGGTQAQALPRTRKGGEQADTRRGEAGASLQHKTKPYIRHMAEPRISDPAKAGLKVVPISSGEARCTSVGLSPEITGNRDNRFTKSPASVGHRILSTDELNSIRRRTQRQGCEGGQISE